MVDSYEELTRNLEKVWTFQVGTPRPVRSMEHERILKPRKPLITNISSSMSLLSLRHIKTKKLKCVGVTIITTI
jgi:hypothetical protein